MSYANEIEAELLKCHSIDICNKIKNSSGKKFCIEYVYKHVTQFNMSIMEGIGALDEYLSEL